MRKPPLEMKKPLILVRYTDSTTHTFVDRIIKPKLQQLFFARKSEEEKVHSKI